MVLAALAIASQTDGVRAEPLLKISAVQVGWKGKYKAGHWTRVQLAISSPESVRGMLRLIVPDGDGVPAEFGADEPEIEFVGRSEESLALVRYVQAGTIRGTINAVFTAEDGRTWQQALVIPPPLAATQSLVLTLGPEVGVSDSLQHLRRQQEESVVGVVIDDAADLPTEWFAYHAVDAVVLPTGVDSLEPKILPPQLAALQQWVAQQGRLVLSAGSRAGELFGSEGRWKDFAPGTFEKTLPLARTAGLETAGGNALAIEDFGRGGLPVAEFTDLNGAIELREGGIRPPNRPLVVRSAYRFGQIVYVAFDCDAPAFAEWPGRGLFIASLLKAGRRGQEGEQAQEARGQVTELGYTDMAGQLRVGLEQFGGVTFIDFSSIAVLILIYLLLIGPGDYFLLERFNLPRHLTWFTFPLLTLIFAGLGWYLATQAHGNRVRLTQAEVIDLDASSGLVRGTLWTHLYSPTTRTFDLQLATNQELTKGPTLQGGWLGWQGLPGKGVGGLSATQTAAVVATPYREATPGPQPALVQLPLPTASSKALAGRWWGETPATSQSTLAADPFGTLKGELTNPLPVELQSAWLLYENWLYFLPATFAPGEKLDLSSIRYFSLEARLTQRKTTGDKDVSTPWDPTLTEVPQIMPLLLFHAAARGQSYTGLSHRYQAYLDLSDHLTVGRAVLVGRSSQHVTELRDSTTPLTAEDDQRWTWWRVVLPVKGKDSQ